MPYKSRAQQRFFHANRAKLEAQGVNVSEWDESTGSKRLPEKLGKSRRQKENIKLKRALT